MLEQIAQFTDGVKLLQALQGWAKTIKGAVDSNGSTASFEAGYLAAYIAELNRQRIANQVEVRPLSDAEVDELLVNVSIAKLEKLLDERRRELADTPDDLRETLADIARTPATLGDGLGADDCYFPGCTIKRPKGSMFCEAHEDRTDELVDCWVCEGTGLIEGTHCQSCDGTGKAADVFA
jgi:hypothetical protein